MMMAATDDPNLWKASDFEQKINNLEFEASELLKPSFHHDDFESTEDGLSDTTSISSIKPTVSFQLSPPKASLKSLVDIAEDQQTISELRDQLDAQAKETDKLKSRLLHGFAVPPLQVTSSTETSDPYRPSSLTVETASSHRGLSSTSHPSSNMNEYQDLLLEVRKQSREAQVRLEKDKLELMKENEDLRRVAKDEEDRRQSIAHRRDDELASKDAMIQRLQSALQHLQDSARQKDEEQGDVRGKAASLQQELHVTESFLDRLRGTVQALQQRRGRSYLDIGRGEQGASGAALLVQGVEACLRDLDNDLQQQQSQCTQMEQIVEQTKRQSNADREKLIHEHQQMLAAAAEEHDKQLSSAAERCMAARRQAQLLQQQLHTLQEQSQEQMSARASESSELEQRIISLQQQHEKDKHHFSSKRKALQQALDESQREIASLRSERDHGVREMAVADSRETDYQRQIEALKEEIQASREETQRIETNRQVALEKIISLEAQKASAEAAIEDTRIRYQEQLESATLAEQERSASQVASLQQRLDMISETNRKQSRDADDVNGELRQIRERNGELVAAAEAARVKLDSTQREQEQLRRLLDDKCEEQTRLQRERDDAYRLLEQRNSELADLRVSRERLSCKLEERESGLSVLKEQTDHMTQAAEVSAATVREIVNKQETLQRDLSERCIQLESARATADGLTDRLSIQQTRNRELESTVSRLECELRESRESFERAETSRVEVSAALSEAESAQTELRSCASRAQRQLEKREQELTKLMSTVRNLEQDLKLSKRAMKCKETMDGKAMVAADQLQQALTAKRGETDSLMTQLRWYEETCDSLSKERESTSRENAQLRGMVQTLSDQVKRVKRQLQEQTRNSESMARSIAKLETQLEKEHLKGASSNSQKATLEQDIAKLKLKHHLELKEAQRAAAKPLKPNIRPAIRATSQEPIKVQTRILRDQSTATSFVEQPNNPAVDVAAEEPADLTEIVPARTSRKERKQQLENEVSSDLRELMTEFRHMLKKVDTKSPEAFSDSELDCSVNLQKQRHRRKGPVVSTPMSRDTGALSRDFSPVRMLLGSAAPSTVPGVVDDETLNTFDDSRLSPDAPQTPQVCRQLENRIKNLQKLGRGLQKENRDMSEFLKDHGRKIRKVKEKELEETSKSYRVKRASRNGKIGKSKKI